MSGRPGRSGRKQDTAQSLRWCRFGHLSPLARVLQLTTDKREPVWLCLCRCGAFICAGAYKLREGKIRCCDGCRVARQTSMGVAHAHIERASVAR